MPDPPCNLKATPNTHQSATVSWDPPEGAIPIKDYKVVIKVNKYGKMSFFQDIVTSDLSYSLDNLTQDNYIFMVQSRNDNGSSEFVTSDTFSLPPPPPTELVVKSRGRDSCNLDWRRPKNSNVKDYLITIEKYDDNGEKVVVRVEITTQTYFLMSNLSSATHFFSVQARNEWGLSEKVVSEPSTYIYGTAPPKAGRTLDRQRGKTIEYSNTIICGDKLIIYMSFQHSICSSCNYVLST